MQHLVANNSHYLTSYLLPTCCCSSLIGVASSSPWSQSSGDGGDRFKLKTMCQTWNTSHSWCPSIYNPLQLGIKAYDSMGEWAELANGVRFYPILKDDCNVTCKKAPNNTAYIGSDPNKDWGMAFGGGAPTEDDGGATAEDDGGDPVEDEGGAPVAASATVMGNAKDQATVNTLEVSSGRIKMISTIVTGVSVFLCAFLLSA